MVWKFLCLVVLLVCLASQGDCWRRRRRRRAPAVNCGVSSWTAWSACSKSCGNGLSTRKRSIVSHARNGGSCSYSFAEKRYCNPDKCPIDCRWSSWGIWSDCSSCMPSRSRARNVSSPAYFGGRPCQGSGYDTNYACYPRGQCRLQNCNNVTEFACLDGLTCVRKRFRCNGDDDCTDYSDEEECVGQNTRNPCRRYGSNLEGIPNIDIAGAGFDIVRYQQSGNIMDNHQYNGRCTLIRSGDHGKQFRKPANIQFFNFQVSTDTSFTTKSYESAKSFFQEEKGDSQRKFSADSSFTYGDIFSIGGKASRSSDGKFKRIIDQATSSDSKYFKISSGIRLAQFRTLRGNFFLSVPFRERLSQLPNHYDYAKYYEMIHDFGTHFYSWGYLGGQYEFIYRYSRSDLKLSGLSDTEQKNCLQQEASFKLFGFKLGGGNQKCSSNSLSQRHKGSFTLAASEVISNVKGGSSDTAASLSFSAQSEPNTEKFNNWVKTVKKNPAITDYKLRPISSAIPRGPKRINMEKALIEYLQQFDPARCTNPCLNNGGYVVVNDGKECKCLCAAGYSGTSCGVKV